MSEKTIGELRYMLSLKKVIDYSLLRRIEIELAYRQAEKESCFG